MFLQNMYKLPHWLQNAHFSYTFDNAPDIEPEVFFVSEVMEHVEVSTDILDHSQNAVDDSISFAGEP